MLDRRLLIPFIAGFNSILVQLILIRELINLFHGTEMVIGIALGFWMFGTGIGAIIGNRARGLKKYLLLAIFMPIISFIIIKSGRLILNKPPSELMGITSELLFIPLPILLFSILSGMLFPLSTRLFKEIEVRRVYIVESIGSFTGGILFTFLMVKILTPFYILILTVMLHTISGIFFFKDMKNFIPPILLSSVLLLSNAERILLKYFWYPFKVVHVKDTPYQNVALIKNMDIISVYGAGELYFSYPDPIRKEVFVDPVMLYTKGKKGLYIGYDLQIRDEMERYNIDVDFVIEDEYLMKSILSRVFKKDITYYKNPVYFIKKTKDKYNVILGDLPPPYTLHLNRFYTLEFFKSIYASLKREGLFAFQFPGGENYLSEEVLYSVSLIKNTMEEAFDTVLVLPGENLIFMGFKKRKGIKSIQTLWEEKGREGLYVNDVYIRDRFSFFRMATLEGVDTITTDKNTILSPKSFLSFNIINSLLVGDRLIAEILKRIDKKDIYIIGVLIVVIILLFYIKRKKNIFAEAIGISGATEIGMEIISIYIFQSLFGNAYTMMGIIFASFMAGLGLGAFLYREGNEMIKFYISEALLFLYPLLFIIFILIIKVLSLPLIVGTLLFSLWAFISGGVGGYHYAVSTHLYGKEKAGVTYGWDLLGSFTGSMLLSFLLIPISGIPFSLAFLSLLNLLILIMAIFL